VSGWHSFSSAVCGDLSIQPRQFAKKAVAERAVSIPRPKTLWRRYPADLAMDQVTYLAHLSLAINSMVPRPKPDGDLILSSKRNKRARHPNHVLRDGQKSEGAHLQQQCLRCPPRRPHSLSSQPHAIVTAPPRCSTWQKKAPFHPCFWGPVL